MSQIIKKHGGARHGAGRPKVEGERLVHLHVKVTKIQKQKFLALEGHGSVMIRRFLDKL